MAFTMLWLIQHWNCTTAARVLIADNDNWQGDINNNLLKNVGLGPGDARESAIFTVLAPGNYTAIVRGKNNTTGVALGGGILIESYIKIGRLRATLRTGATRLRVSEGRGPGAAR